MAKLKLGKYQIKPQYLIGFLLVVFFLVSLVVATYLVEKSKAPRKSEAAATASLSIVPQTVTVVQNQNQTFKIMLNTSVATEKIGFARVDILFDKNNFEFVSITPSGDFVIPQRTNGDYLSSTVAQANLDGKFYAAMLIPIEKIASAPSGNFELATFVLKAIMPTTTNITVPNILFDTGSDLMEVVSLNEDANQRNLVLQFSNSSAVVTASGSTSSPSPTPTTKPTPTPTPTVAPTKVPTTAPTSTPTVSADPRADINQDGLVNLLDYIILLENFGKSFN